MANRGVGGGILIMNIIFFDAKPFEKPYFSKALLGHNLFFTPFEADKFVEENTLVKKLPFKIEKTDAVSGFIYSNFTSAVLAFFPKLKIIATRSTGTDHIDLKECSRRGIDVRSVPEYGTNTVAEHTWALILALIRKIPQSTEKAKKGDFSRENLQGFDTFGKTLGIVGCGKIGSRVGELGRAFGCSVLAFDPYADAKSLAGRGFLKASLGEIYSNCDIVSFHTPLTKETIHLLSTKDIQDLKRGVFIINTARGGLIETKALLRGLQDGVIAGVALDVLEEEEDLAEEAELIHGRKLTSSEKETLLQNHILLKDERVLITPHNAFNTKEALERIMEKTVENILNLKVQSSNAKKILNNK